MKQQLINAFLTWELPTSVCCDNCVIMADYPHTRYGTSLLNENQASDMVEHLLQTLKGNIGELDYIFSSLQNGDISKGKARELVNDWLSK